MSYSIEKTIDGSRCPFLQALREGNLSFNITLSKIEMANPLYKAMKNNYLATSQLYDIKFANVGLKAPKKTFIEHVLNSHYEFGSRSSNRSIFNSSENFLDLAYEAWSGGELKE